MLNAGTITATLDLDTNQFYAKLKNAEQELARFGGRLGGNPGGSPSGGRTGGRTGGGSGGGIPGLVASPSQLNTVNRSVTNLTAGIRGLNTVLAGLSFAAATRGAVLAGEEFNALNRRLLMTETVLSGMGETSMDAGQMLSYLSGLAASSGQDVGVLSETFTALASAAGSAGVPLETIRATLEGTIGIGAAYGRTQAEMGRAFQAITQIAAKGVVSMEELRGQLGEALPVAFGVVAQGAGLTTEKLIDLVSAGQFTAKQFFDAWVKGSDQFRQFSQDFGNTLLGQLRQTRNLWTLEVGKLVSDSGMSDALAGMVGEFNSVFASTLKEAQQAGDGIGEAFVQGAETAATALVNAWNTFAPVLHQIHDAAGDVMGGALRTYSSLPPEIREWGVIGAMLLGTSPLKMLAMLAAVGEGAGVAGVAKAYLQGDRAETARRAQSFSGGIGMTADSLSAAYGADAGEEFRGGGYADRLAVIDRLVAVERARMDELQAELAASTDDAMRGAIATAMDLRNGALAWLGAVREGVEIYQKPIKIEFQPLPDRPDGWQLPDPSGTFQGIRDRAGAARDARQRQPDGITLGGSSGGPTAAALAAQRAELEKAKKSIDQIAASYRQAGDALVLMGTSQAEFAARADVERQQIAAGILSQEAAVFSLSEAQLQAKAQEGQRRDISADQVRLQQQIAAMADEEAMAGRDRLAVQQAFLEILMQEEAFRQSASPAGMAIEQRGVALSLAQEAHALEMEMARLKDETFVRKEEELAIQRELVDLQRLHNQYAMDLGTYAATNLVEGAQNFKNTLAGGISDLAMGMKSIGEVGRDMFKSLVAGVIDFFAQWIAQQIAAWAISKALGLAGVATTAATATATALAWAPAAALASLATLGTNAAPAAAGIASTVAFSKTMAAVPVFHDGGLVGDNLLRLPGMLPDEGLALLQQGEMVLPRSMVQREGLPPASLIADSVTADGGYAVPPAVREVQGDGGAGAGIDYEFLAELLGSKINAAVPTVAVLPADAIDKHLIRNPGSVLHVIEEDMRNNGNTSRRMRSR